MTVYLVVYGRDPSDRLAAYALPDRDAAHALASRLPTDGHAHVIETEAEIRFTGPDLVAVYNGLGGQNAHVNRFENRAVGAQRLFTLLSTVAVSTQKEEASVPETTRPGRRSRFNDNDVIEVVVTENPKKSGKKNHERFAALMALGRQTTVGAAVAAGVTLGDLAYDAKKGYVKVNPSRAAAAE